MQKVIHYSLGYEGKYNYKTICGKEIHSHSETEDTTIRTRDVNCEHCIATPAWMQDDRDYLDMKSTCKRRIFIESDILHADELRSAQSEVASLCETRGEPFIGRVFADILDFAWHDLERTWDAVKNADEIYADSSLMPLSGGSYMGAPVIFNGMMERAIKEGVTGKDVYILNPVKYISWYMIKLELMEKAFSGNRLFMYDDKYEIIEIDVKKIVKEQRKK